MINDATAQFKRCLINSEKVTPFILVLDMVRWGKYSGICLCIGSSLSMSLSSTLFSFYSPTLLSTI